MTFTYTGDPSVSDRDKVRFLIGDTDSTDPHFQDEEIMWLVNTWNDVYEAAAVCADILGGRFAHKADVSKTVGDLSLSTTYSRAAEGFKVMAHQMRDMRARQFVPMPVVNAQALVSTENRRVETYNTDFFLGMDDYKGPYGSDVGR